MQRTSKIIWLLCGILVFAVPFYLHYTYLLNAFYHFGAPINDAGIFAQVAWHGDWKLTTPAVFTNYSFFGVHCTPILAVLTEISYLAPLDMAEYYSMFLAAVYACLSLALFYALAISTKFRSLWQIPVIAIICGLFAFNNSIMSGIWIGHIEYAIPLGIFMFLLFFAQNKKWLCIAAFIFTLSIREDAGLHLTAVLGLLALVRFYETGSLKAIKRELYFIIIAVLYSAFAVWVSIAARNYFGSTFQTIYSGHPAYAHLNWQVLGTRAVQIAEQHIDLCVGFVATLAVAIYTRNIYMMIGFAAYIPWLIFNWTAYNANTGILYAYYSFPFILSLMWPVLGAVWRHGLPLENKVARQVIFLQLVLVLGSLISLNDDSKTPEFGPLYLARWGSYETQDGLRNRDLVLEFFDKIQRGKGNLGRIMADQGSITMVKGGRYQGLDLLRLESDKPADTIIAMLPDKDDVPPEITKQAEKNHMPYKYCLDGFTVCIFTNRTLQQIGH